MTATTVPIEPVAVDVTTAAAMIGCGKSKIRDLVRDGVLSKVPHMGNRVIISVRALEPLANSEISR